MISRERAATHLFVQYGGAKTLSLNADLSVDNGLVRTINPRGINKTVRAPVDVLLSEPAIRQILEQGRVIERRDGDGKGIKNIWVYSANVVLKGKTLPLSVVVRESQDGRRQYLFHEMPDEVGPGTTAKAAGDSGKASITPAIGDAGSDLNLIILGEVSNSPASAPDLRALQSRLESYGIARKVALRLTDRWAPPITR